MTPLSRRGSDWPWNIQLLCAFHNSSKGELTDGEYREREGLPARQWMDHPYYALVVAALI
jgi:5-methylcytosine-specific restriction endonuclease McrA